jgi:alpha/beta superfamily hydrolase
MMETTVFFGPEGTLVGTHACRDGGVPAAGGLAVILTNAGVIARTGPHGLNVALARALAGIGVPSIRFDMSGIGDSRRSASTLPIEEQFVRDTRAAIDEAQSRHGAQRFAMIGFCSGADVAHLAALQDERICALLLWDPYIYPTLRSKLVRLQNLVKEYGPREALRRALRLAVRALGERIGRARARGGQGLVPATRYGRSHIPPVAEYAARLRELLDRGVEIRILYSGGFPSDYNYATQYRDSFRGRGIADRISCTYLPRSDHTLTSRSSQRELLGVALEWISSLRDAPAGPAASPARP